MTDQIRYPNLFLAGAPKCGTSSLAFWLGQHPEIFAPVAKEPMIWATDLISETPHDPAERTRLHFGAWEGEPFALDATTQYFFSKSAPHEIAASAPDARVYVMVRNPAEAVHSMYHQLCFNGMETAAKLEESLAAEEDRSRSLQPSPYGYPESMLYSRVFSYAENISNFEHALGKDRVRVILLDDVLADPKRVVASILGELGLDKAAADTIDYGVRNTAKRSRSKWLHKFVVYPPTWAGALTGLVMSKNMRLKIRQKVRALNTVPQTNPPLKPETRAKLNDLFRADVDWLERHLGRDLGHWRGVD